LSWHAGQSALYFEQLLSAAVPEPRECTMPNFNRRDALKMSAGFAPTAAAGGFACIEMAQAGPIEVPVIDKLSVRVLVDNTTDIFFKPRK
jgi:hypothetical protein